MPDAELIEDFLGEEVVDKEGLPVGNFTCYWERDVKKALLLGVDVPERPDHTHLVPARAARFNERRGYVQVAFSRTQILQAPCLKCECEIDEEFETAVWAFYGLPVPSPDAADPLGQRAKALRQELRRIMNGSAGKSGKGPAGSTLCDTDTAKGNPA